NGTDPPSHSSGASVVSTSRRANASGSQEGSAMTYRPNQSIAAEIQSQLRKAMEHDHIKVKSLGRHFLIQLELEDGVETVARITSITSKLYGAAFRTHTGRWEPVP